MACSCPPRQNAASFNLDSVMASLHETRRPWQDIKMEKGPGSFVLGFRRKERSYAFYRHMHP
jgi:hypothetical protein